MNQYEAQGTPRRKFMLGSLSLVIFPAAVMAQQVTQEQQIYRDNPGNEFVMKFTSKAAPEGRDIVIDPDDTMPLIDPRNGKFTVTPRFRFLEKINRGLPNVPGELSQGEIARMVESPGSYSVDGRSVASLFHHLTHYHGVPQNQIWEAVKKSSEIRAREMGF